MNFNQMNQIDELVSQNMAFYKNIFKSCNEILDNSEKLVQLESDLNYKPKKQRCEMYQISTNQRLPWPNDLKMSPSKIKYDSTSNETYKGKISFPKYKLNVHESTKSNLPKEPDKKISYLSTVHSASNPKSEVNSIKSSDLSKPNNISLRKEISKTEKLEYSSENNLQSFNSSEVVLYKKKENIDFSKQDSITLSLFSDEEQFKNSGSMCNSENCNDGDQLSSNPNIHNLIKSFIDSSKNIIGVLCSTQSKGITSKDSIISYYAIIQNATTTAAKSAAALVQRYNDCSVESSYQNKMIIKSSVNYLTKNETVDNLTTLISDFSKLADTNKYLEDFSMINSKTYSNSKKSIVITSELPEFLGEIDVKKPIFDFEQHPNYNEIPISSSSINLFEDGFRGGDGQWYRRPDVYEACLKELCDLTSFANHVGLEKILVPYSNNICFSLGEGGRELLRACLNTKGCKGRQLQGASVPVLLQLAHEWGLWNVALRIRIERHTGKLSPKHEAFVKFKAIQSHLRKSLKREQMHTERDRRGQITDIRFEEMKHLTLGKEGRERLRTELRRLHDREPYRMEDLLEKYGFRYSELRNATVPQLLKMAYICCMWHEVVDACKKQEAKKETKSKKESKLYNVLHST